jgi:hypothetical protein
MKHWLMILLASLALLSACGGQPEDESVSEAELRAGGWELACSYVTVMWTCSGPNPWVCPEGGELCQEVECDDYGCVATGGGWGCMDPAQVPGPGTRPTCKWVPVED